MAAVLVFLLLTSTTAVSRVGGENECPPLFEWVNTSDSSSYCMCVVEVSSNTYCNQRHQRSFLAHGSCAFYDSEKDALQVSSCPYLFPKSATEDGMFPLPANVSELNSVVCGNLSREVKGPLCGRCTNDTGPSIYSVGSRCVHCSPFNILYYLLLQYLPSTVMFLLVIIFRPNLTSAPMANYIFFCNCVVLYTRQFMWYDIKLDSFSTGLAKTALTLCAVWSFDVLLFVSPPICILQHVEEIFIPLLEFIATIYPFILLLLTYKVIKLHSRNFKPVVVAWRLFGRVFVQCYRAWDPTSSMIQAFASLLFLSYAKLSYLVWGTFVWSDDMNSKDNVKRVLYMDPNVPYRSTKHVLLMTFSVAVAFTVVLPPLFILLVYPTSLYQKISHRIQPKWNLRIKIFVETFQGCFKDDTNGTRDYRPFSGALLLLGGAAPQLLFAIITLITTPSMPNICNICLPVYFMAILFCSLSFLCTLLLPYKDNMANALAVGLLVLSGLIWVTVGEFLYSGGDYVLKITMSILILVPHCVLWGYIFWRFVKAISAYCCKCETREEEKLLQGLLKD